MTDWDRRRLLDISGVIRRCMNSDGLSGEQKGALRTAFDLANVGKHCVRTDELEVEKVKRALCEACRQGRLYKCDDGVCGTESCALYNDNNK